MKLRVLPLKEKVPLEVTPPDETPVPLKEGKIVARSVAPVKIFDHDLLVFQKASLKDPPRTMLKTDELPETLPAMSLS